MDWSDWGEIEAWGKTKTRWHGQDAAVAELARGRYPYYSRFYNMETGEIWVEDYDGEFDFGFEVVEGESIESEWMDDPETRVTAGELIEDAERCKRDLYEKLWVRYSPEAEVRRIQHGF